MSLRIAYCGYWQKEWEEIITKYEAGRAAAQVVSREASLVEKSADEERDKRCWEKDGSWDIDKQKGGKLIEANPSYASLWCKRTFRRCCKCKKYPHYIGITRDFLVYKPHRAAEMVTKYINYRKAIFQAVNVVRNAIRAINMLRATLPERLQDDAILQPGAPEPPKAPVGNKPSLCLRFKRCCCTCCKNKKYYAEVAGQILDNLIVHKY